MISGPARVKRERETIISMLEIYCSGNHGTAGTLCAACDELLGYVMLRLEKCPFGAADKPTCANCKIHCYQTAMRERIKKVMRFSGPRLGRSHPVLAALHILDGFRSAPLRPLSR